MLISLKLTPPASMTSVCTLDRLEDGGGRSGPGIDADELGMGLGQDPLVHRHRGERAAQRLDQRPELSWSLNRETV